MSHQQASRYILALLTLVLILNPGKAMIIEYTLPELVQSSDVIVRGQVTRTACRWGSVPWSPETKTIVTDAFIMVSEVLNGTLTDNQVVVESRGGVIGDLGLMIEDQPGFRTDQEVILFLNPATDNGIRTVTNHRNGKYTVTENIVVESGEPVDQFVRRIAQSVQD